MIMLLVDLLQCSAVLTAIIVGFTSDFVNAENKTECVNGSQLCYIYADQEQDWDSASNICKLKNATLPVILTRTEQVDFVRILEIFGTNNEVWTSGKRHAYGEFTWINGRPYMYNRRESAVVQRNEYTHVKINRSLHFIAAHPGHLVYSFCQFSGAKCSPDKSSLIQLANGCLNMNDIKDLPWYQARTRCLDAGGDLAVLEDADLTNLTDWFKNSRNAQNHNDFWIGLRNSSFRWFTKVTAGLEDEISYSNFSNTTRFWNENACISVRSSDGQWNLTRCENMKKVVCQQRMVLTLSPATTTASTSTSATLKLRVTNPSTSTSTTTKSASVITTAGGPNASPTSSKAADRNGSDQGEESNSGAVLAVAAAIGAVVVIICIIIIIVVVMKRRRSEKSECGTEAGQNGPYTRTHMYENRQQTLTDNQCQYAEINRGQYAEIPLLTKAPEAPVASGSNPPPGTEYATIDFQKDPKNEESTSKSVTTNVGAQEGQVIYAEPVRKSIAKDHSPGNVVPTKVGPLGDTYALPSTHHGSSNPKSPKEHHYANIKT